MEEKTIFEFEDTINPDAEKITDCIEKLSQVSLENVKTFAAEKIEVEGVNIFDFLLKVKDCLESLQIIEKDLKEYAINELYKYPNGKYDGRGYTCVMVESGFTYDYKQSKDWIEINEKKKELETQLKKVLKPKSTTTVRFERKRY
jgi:hypothetical protein